MVWTFLRREKFPARTGNRTLDLPALPTALCKANYRTGIIQVCMQIEFRCSRNVSWIIWNFRWNSCLVAWRNGRRPDAMFFFFFVSVPTFWCKQDSELRACLCQNDFKGGRELTVCLFALIEFYTSKLVNFLRNLDRLILGPVRHVAMRIVWRDRNTILI